MLLYLPKLRKPRVSRGIRHRRSPGFLTRTTGCDPAERDLEALQCALPFQPLNYILRHARTLPRYFDKSFLPGLNDI
jgi:hypothetical protein